MSNPQGNRIRTNYRVNSSAQIADGLLINQVASQIVRLRQTWQHDATTGDIVTFSMDGYGRPLWVQVMPLSDHRGTILQVNCNLSVSESLVVASILATASMGSLGATVSYVWEILALIASR